MHKERQNTYSTIKAEAMGKIISCKEMMDEEHVQKERRPIIFSVNIFLKGWKGAKIELYIGVIK